MPSNSQLDDVTARSLHDMLERGVLEPSLRKVARNVFEHEDFTLTVLQSHLLIEKALNARLAEKGVPSTLLGQGGLQFHQKYKAYKELRGENPNGPTMFEVLNTLRNSVAHDLVDEHDCVRQAFRRAFPKNAQRQIVEDAVAMGLDAVKMLFLMLALDVGIIAPGYGFRQFLIEYARPIDEFGRSSETG
jgi:hypothetical protein